MGILGWILFGLIVGALAKLVMPGRDPGGIIVTMLLGIAGAVIGGFVGRALGFYGEGEAAGFLMSFLGAVVLLALYRMMVGTAQPRRSGRRPARASQVHKLRPMPAPRPAAAHDARPLRHPALSHGAT